MRGALTGGIAGLALAAVSPARAQVMPPDAVAMSEEEALARAVYAELKAAPDKVFEAPNRRFHSVPVAGLFYPGDLGEAFRGYDSRESSYYDASKVERWYAAQVPYNVPFVERDSNAKILYLPSCTAPYAYDIEFNLGDDYVGSLDRNMIERLSIRRALEEEGLGDVEVPEMYRTYGGERDGPRLEITELNRRIAEEIARQDGDDPREPRLMLVLEGYCGSRTEPLGFPKLVPEPRPEMTPTPSPTPAPTYYYRLQMPDGVSSGTAASFIYAEACRYRRNSRTATNCDRWAPVSSYSPLTGRGRYRMVASVNGQLRSFLYSVLEINLSPNADATPVIPIPEP